MKAMVLAAGLGTRMGTLTASTPKALLEIGGESLLGHQLARLAAAGIDEVVVNIARHGEQIVAAIGNGRRFGVHVRYSDEGPQPLETAGGIIKALPMLGAEPFVLANADVHTDFDFAALAIGDDDGRIILVPNPPHHPRGDFALDGRGRVVESGERLTYAGIALLHPKLFAGLAPGPRPLKPLLDAAIARGALSGQRHDGLWIDVGTPERLAEARRHASLSVSSRAAGSA